MPYVHFASPGAKQVWPNSAACWSPSAAAMLTPGSTTDALPYTSAEERISGSIARGTPIAASRWSDHCSVEMSISMVRDWRWSRP